VGNIAWDGTGIYCWPQRDNANPARAVQLRNCIVWGNRGNQKVDRRPGRQLAGLVFASRCCVEDGTGQIQGSSPPSQDPLFVDPNGPDGMPGTEDDDLRLKPGSPCIDAGDANALPMDSEDLDGDRDRIEPIPVDLAGVPRVVGGSVDIGAYEHPSPAAPPPATAPATQPRARWGFRGPDGRAVYPPLPNPNEPVDYIAWINKTFAVPDEENAAVDYIAGAGKAVEQYRKPAKPIGRIPRLREFPYVDAFAVMQTVESQPGVRDFRRGMGKSKCFFRLYPYKFEGPADPRRDRSLRVAEMDSCLYEGGRRTYPGRPACFLYEGAAMVFAAEGSAAWQLGDRQALIDNAMGLLRLQRHLRSHPRPVFEVDDDDNMWMASLPYVMLTMALQLTEDPAGLARRVLPILVKADPDEPEHLPVGYGSMAFSTVRLWMWDHLQRLFVPGETPGTWTVRPPVTRGVDPQVQRLAEVGFPAAFRQFERNADEAARWLAMPYSEVMKRYDELKRLGEQADGNLMRTGAAMAANVYDPKRTVGNLLVLGVYFRRATHLVYYIFDHKARTGQFPDSLGELKGTTTAQARKDPFSGKDFVYRAEGQDFVLYSVGKDMNDNGGKLSGGAGNSDLVAWPRRASFVHDQDFETGQAEGWKTQGPADVVSEAGGNRVLRVHKGGLARLEGRTWGGFTLRVRVKLVRGSCEIRYKDGISKRYTLLIEPASLAIRRDLEPEGRARLWRVQSDHELGRWYVIEIRAMGGRLEVCVDGKLKIRCVDTEPVLRGGVSLAVDDDSEVRFDDIAIRPTCLKLGEDRSSFIASGRLTTPPTDGLAIEVEDITIGPTFSKVSPAELRLVAKTRPYTKWPFDAQEAKRRQDQTSRTLGVSETAELDLGGGVRMKLALIPPGTFVMGSPEEEARKPHGKDERPLHRVTITRPFYMSVTEVTRAQYEAVTKYDVGSSRGAQKAAGVSWENAVTFCRKLTGRTGLLVRLPTEAEWEYACRAGTDTPWHFGRDPAVFVRYGWSSPRGLMGMGLREPPDVAKKKPNAWGLYDMHGNEREWCYDWYGRDYYTASAMTDPRGPASGKYRVARGGGSNNGPGPCRSAARGELVLGAGLRIVASVLAGVKPQGQTGKGK